MNVNTSNKWTRALWEPTAGVQTNKACVALTDLQGNHDYQLVLVDESTQPCRLKLYKGLKPAVESVLAEQPTGIVGFVCDSGDSESTCLAVACGASLLIYRNMKPYYRYNLPQKDILPPESELWAQLKIGKLQKEQLIEGLKHLQLEHSIGELSYQSRQLLTLEDPNGQLQDAFIDHVLSKETRESSSQDGGVYLTNVQITCMATIPRNQSQTSAVDVLLLGTERGSIYFVDSQAYTVLQKSSVAAVPVKILPIGHYDLEYRIVICTREHDVFVLRKNGKGDLSSSSFYVREHPFDVVLCASQLVFATRKRRLVFFSQKCRRQNSMQFEEDIMDIEQFYYEPKQYNGVLVVLANDIHLYIDQLKVDTIRMDRPIDWIHFGKMGREEGVLVIATQGGGLCVKIFRRVANFDDGRQALMASNQKKTIRAAIELPKKSRTFVDQSLRERENPRQLHQIYQRDWFMVKWHTTKTYAALETGKASDLMVGAKEAEPLQVQYEVLGFGPRFRLQIRLLSSGKLDDRERWMVFIYNTKEYTFTDRMIPVPHLMPNRQVTLCTEIQCLHPEKQLCEEEVRMLLCKKDWTRPIWATTFQLPMSEPEIG